MVTANVSKSFFRIRFIENVLLHEAVETLMVLSPPIHFLDNEIINWLSLAKHELIAIEVSEVVHDFTPDRLIGSANVSEEEPSE